MAGETAQGWRPFILVAMMLGAGTMGATMASPLFPIYEREWGIGHGTVTWLYVAYMIGVMAALLFLGGATGRFGAIRVLRAGAGLLMAGLYLSAAAVDAAMLIPVRVLIGVAAGMITSAATLGLFRLEPGAGRRAAVVASTITMAGFSLGPLLCGLIAQWAPLPLALPYLIIALPVVALLVSLSKTQADAPACGRFRLCPQLGLPGREGNATFLVAAASVFSAYAVFSLLASLAPSFLPLILPWHGPAVSGAAVAVVLMVSAAVQIPARRLPPHRTLPLALGLLAGGCIMLALAMHLQMASLFVLADLLIGCGHGLSYLSGMTRIDVSTPHEKRGPVLTTLLCIAYLGTILPILAVGWLADQAGLGIAVTAFCLVFAAACAALLAASRGLAAPASAPPR